MAIHHRLSLCGRENLFDIVDKLLLSLEVSFIGFPPISPACHSNHGHGKLDIFRTEVAVLLSWCEFPLDQMIFPIQCQ